MSISERLDQIEARSAAATEGPWAPWLDQDGADHMQGLLMVGNADAVIPEGEWWVEGVDVNPIAHTYCEEDRAFIAHSRTDVPALVAALRAVLDLHEGEPYAQGPDYCVECEQRSRCSTYTAIESALGEGNQA